MKILLADDHAVVRRGLKQIILDTYPKTTFGEAENPTELFNLAKRGPWDILVLDLNMPGTDGLDALKQLKHDYPQLPVLILSIHPEDQFAIRTLRAGAAGYLTKESAPDQLIQAIDKILHGGKYISPMVADTLVAHVGEDNNKLPHEKLSDREYQVLRMIATGKELKQISEELALSVKTISTYRARILEKMAMRTNAELIHYAIENKLV
jgi:DNA-binding NarL/FixJ family response regulator